MMDYAMTANLSIRKTLTLERIVYRSTLLISCLSVFYLLSVFITGRIQPSTAEMDAATSELTLSLIQCLLGIAVLHLPMLVTKLTRVKLPNSLRSFFYIFVVCGTVLGEMFSLYYAIPFWDSLLHFGSGIMLAIHGSILLVNFFRQKNCQNLISPVFIAIVAVCFALCIGVFWEIYEFAADCLLDLNMQKALLQDGTELIGKAALIDTMKDLIVDTAGAIVAAVAAYLSLKNNNGWLYSYINETSMRDSVQHVYDKKSLQRSA